MSARISSAAANTGRRKRRRKTRRRRGKGEGNAQEAIPRRPRVEIVFRTASGSSSICIALFSPEDSVRPGSARSRAIRALFAPGSRYIKERMCESALTRIRDRPYTFLFVAMVADDVVVVVAVASCRGVGRFMNTDFHSALATSNRYEAGTAFGHARYQILSGK